MNKYIDQIILQTKLSEQQAWWLLECVADKTRSQLQFSSNFLNAAQEHALEIYMTQLVQDHKPLAYILGWVPFLDLTIKVSPPTLIPRLETEFWVDQLICQIKYLDHQKLTILDIGTGSGCIALSLAQAFPLAHVYAVDIAQSAIDLARENAKLNGLGNVNFIQSNLFAQLPADLRFDLIVSNPPYIDPVVKLEASVASWEDHGALFAQNQGMQMIEEILIQAPAWLTKNNEREFQITPEIVIEIDASHGAAVKKIAQKYGFRDVIIKKDQFDRDRTMWAIVKAI